MSPRQITLKKSALSARAKHVARQMVVIDQSPLRRSIAADCTAAMTRLESARAGWHRFEREDKPAFNRWKAREFGALLSEARDVEVQIRDAQALVGEVEKEMRRAFQSPQSAYRRVMFQRENPGAADEEPPGFDTGKSGMASKLSEFEQEALFQEWVQKFLGTNPDKMDDDAYTTRFEVFKSHMFRGLAEEPRSRNTKRPDAKAKIAPKEEADEEETMAAVDARVKALYRRLVRRLHPDLRADGSAHVSGLWHEVQQAYAASDVARMELLLALSNIQSNELGDGTSVSQMHSVLAELKRSLRALEKSLLEAQGEDAWNFARKGANDDLRLRVERQLKLDLAARTRHLALLTRTLAEWAQGPTLNVTSVRRRQFAG